MNRGVEKRRGESNVFGKGIWELRGGLIRGEEGVGKLTWD